MVTRSGYLRCGNCQHRNEFQIELPVEQARKIKGPLQASVSKAVDEMPKLCSYCGRQFSAELLTKNGKIPEHDLLSFPGTCPGSLEPPVRMGHGAPLGIHQKIEQARMNVLRQEVRTAKKQQRSRTSRK